MLTTDCPLCDGPITLEFRDPAVACDACGITIEFAPDAPKTVLAAAA